MEENEDEPEDVRKATPVEDEIVKGEKDEKAKEDGPNVKKRAKARCDKNLKKKSKADGNTEKSDADCCRGRRGELSKAPKTTTVLVYEKPCTLPKLEIIPRHCLSKKEYIDLLATPSRKCPPPCLRKPVVRKIRPISARINELSLPTRQRITATLEERGSTLPPEFVDNLIKVLEGEACMTPEQASRYLRDKKKRGNKKQKKDPRYKCKEKLKKKRSQRVNSLGLDEEAVKCQYLMAERFVKSILEWKCAIPKEEFKDIADVILRRLSYTLNYTPVQEEDRKSQQMRLLADMVASWISGVLFEVAEVHKKELEEECERRRREKEMETDESEEEEDEDEDEEEDEEEDDEEEEEEEEEVITEKEEEKKKPKKDKKKTKEDKKKGKGKKGDKPGREKSAEKDVRETKDEEGSKEKSEEVTETPVREETEVSDAITETEEESKKTPDEEVAVDETKPSEEETAEAEKTLKEEEEAKAAESERIKAEEEEAKLKKEEEEAAEKKKQEDLEEEKRKEAEEEEARKKKEEEDELQKIKQEKEEAEKRKQEEEEAEKRRQEEEAEKQQQEAEAERKKQEEEAEEQKKEKEKLEQQKKEEEEELDKKKREEEKAKEEQLKRKKQEEEAEEQKKEKEKLEQQKKEEEEELDKKKREEEKAKEEQLKAEEEAKKASKIKEEQEKKELEEKLRDRSRETSMNMDDIRKIFKTELSFVTFGRIFDAVNKIIQEETQSSGDDPIANRIKYAIYEKFTNLIKSEDPKLLTENLKDCVNILAGKLSSWLATTITDSQLNFMKKHPAEVESVDIRNWSSWIDSTTSTADRWISWIRKTIREAETMQDKKVTRSEWHDWTKSVDTNALLWRRYYLQTLHQADRNLTALHGRNIVKTGQKGKQNPREMEMKVTDLEAD
ncbi:golgin subfamily A member 6-like protein 6 [Cephus cinctus]|uniref:Golgin subfamily A member 6-like protein 6 n=1 Tax=Cephus cinctus TaxID=211228 RepID=A0AAJ7RSG4_CEPCN|nr:golgin subfamily A member 6-like protein 6 [Cephus cinctus]